MSIAGHFPNEACRVRTGAPMMVKASEPGLAGIFLYASEQFSGMAALTLTIPLPGEEIPRKLKMVQRHFFLWVVVFQLFIVVPEGHAEVREQHDVRLGPDLQRLRNPADLRPMDKLG